MADGSQIFEKYKSHPIIIWRQKGDVKQVLHGASTKFSRPGDLAAGIFTPLRYSV
jgi:hypothetical protein